jgi:hypothetical protein
MHTFGTLLDRWPSIPELARDLGMPAPTVHSWKRRNTVHVEHWPALIASARRLGVRGITLESLMRAAQTSRASRRQEGGTKPRKRRREQPSSHVAPAL